MPKSTGGTTPIPNETQPDDTSNPTSQSEDAAIASLLLLGSSSAAAKTPHLRTSKKSSPATGDIAIGGISRRDNRDDLVAGQKLSHLPTDDEPGDELGLLENTKTTLADDTEDSKLPAQDTQPSNASTRRTRSSVASNEPLSEDGEPEEEDEATKKMKFLSLLPLNILSEYKVRIGTKYTS